MDTEHTVSMQSEPLDRGERRAPRHEVKSRDRPLDPAREPPLGAHIVTARRGYTHHGIYAGEGRVVQYGGLSWGVRRGPIEEVPLSKFSRGRAVWVRVVAPHWFDPHDVVRRARRRLGEDRYSVLSNNCEHFCEWCVRGEHRSYQIEDRIARYRAVLINLIERLTRTRVSARESTATDSPCIGDRYQRAISQTLGKAAETPFIG